MKSVRLIQSGAFLLYRVRNFNTIAVLTNSFGQTIFVAVPVKQLWQFLQMNHVKPNATILIEFIAFAKYFCMMAAFFHPQCVKVDEPYWRNTFNQVRVRNIATEHVIESHICIIKKGLGQACSQNHDDVIKWKHFPRYWPFVRRIHRSPVNSPHKGQWRGALMFSLISVWINDWVNNGEAGDLRRYRIHYDVTVMMSCDSMIQFEKCRFH